MPISLPLHQGGTKTPSRRPMFLRIMAFGLVSWLISVLFFQRSEIMDLMEKTITTEDASSQQPTEPKPMVEEQYGLGDHPAFSDMTQLMDLPATFVPETGKNRHPGRLVVVGDVHGMKEELQALLHKVGFNKKHDHLVLAGDMVSKGPDSPGVVDLAMSLGATGVRGNHEDRIILAAADMKREQVETELPGPSEDSAKKDDALEEESFSHGDYNDRRLVKALGHKRMKWLKECPVILRVGKLGSMGEVVVVHAGLAPGVRLEKQDPSFVMSMRTIGKGGVPSEGRKGKAWTKVWNKYQKTLPKHERTTVIFGHDSKKGLQVDKYSLGLDTSCLKGHRLTAVVIEGGHSEWTHRLVHVNCKDGRGK